MPKAPNTDIKIEKGVPLVPRRATDGRGPRYPWADLTVGDSFLSPTPEGCSLQRLQRRISNLCAYQARTNPGRKFVTRQVEGGVRVWRVA